MDQLKIENSATPVAIEEEMKNSYLDYAMSVIVGRALPDIRDGLKPVHRRVLFAMNEMGNAYNKPYKKSARIVGDVIGKYHPHGDQAVYDTIVRLAQDFSMRYPLVDGQGNFGSVDGDPPAAMRYTEVRMTRLASEFLSDIDKRTVDFAPNYDDTLEEPLILSARVPNILLNGSAGIAVGMATNIPPHNINEINKAIARLIKNPNATVGDLMKDVTGPDFPTGGIIQGRDGIVKAYKNGRGKIKIRSRVEVAPLGKQNRERLIVTELPYQVNKARLLETIANLAREGTVEGISDLRDESDRDGIRMVIELKKDVNAEIVLKQLFHYSQLEVSYSIIMLALVGNRPRIVNLRDTLTEFISFRREVITRRTLYELEKARARAHILEGLKIALDNLDEVIKVIRKSKDPVVARGALMKNFALSQVQAQAILDMRLQRLTNLEREKILEERKQVLAEIKRLEGILADDTKVYAIIGGEAEEMVKIYGDKRRTEIQDAIEQFDAEDLIQEEEVIVTVSNRGYIKRNSMSTYSAQNRGGRGKKGMGSKDEDFPSRIFTASTHHYLLIFTDAGRVYWLKVHQIPQMGRTSKGKPIVTMVKMGKQEQITAILPVADFTEGTYVLMSTRNGTVKKTDLMEFSNPRPSGIRAIKLGSKDTLIGAALTDGKQELIMVTHRGKAIRFSEDNVRSMGRTASGVRGISLGSDDHVVGMALAEKDSFLLPVSVRGYGKRTEMSEYRVQGRGGKGIITTKVTEKNGGIVGLVQLRDGDDVMIMTNRGKVIRLRSKDISVFGRQARGVRLIQIEANEEVSAVAKLVDEDNEIVEK